MIIDICLQEVHIYQYDGYFYYFFQLILSMKHIISIIQIHISFCCLFLYCLFHYLLFSTLIPFSVSLLFILIIITFPSLLIFFSLFTISFLFSQFVILRLKQFIHLLLEYFITLLFTFLPLYFVVVCKKLIMIMCYDLQEGLYSDEQYHQ